MRLAPRAPRRGGRARGLDRVGDQDALPPFALSRPTARPSLTPEAAALMPLGAHVVEDYRHLSLSLYPVAFTRALLDVRGVKRSQALATLKSGERVTPAGAGARATRTAAG